MADVKDDNGLKKAEEALKKAEQNPAFDGPQDSPKFKAAAQKLLKARANFEAAGGVSDATPATIKPIEGLDTPPEPPQPTAPTSPSDQVRNAMVGMRPEGNLGELPQLTEGREAAEAGRIQTKAEVIAEDAKTKKRRERQAKQLRKDKALAAAKKAAYDKGVAERARQAKVDSEAVRAIRERHDKDKPSALEMGFATMTGGLGGLLFGTYDRYLDSSRAANEEVENFKLKNASDEAIRKALVSAKKDRTGAAAAGWGTTAIAAATKASSTLTSNAHGPHFFKEDGKNLLNGIGPNENGDSKEKVIGWFHKTFKKASNGNKKAIREIGAASSRIAGKAELVKPRLKKDLVIADNKNTYMEKLYASVPKYLGEAQTINFDHLWHNEEEIIGQIKAYETLSAYHQMFDVLAESTDPAYADFAAKWKDEVEKGGEYSDILKSVDAMKKLADDTKITITAQRRNVDAVKKAGRKVANIKSKIAEHRKNGEYGTAERMEKNELPEAEENLDLTLAFSGHSDLKVRRGEDGGAEVYSTDSEINFPLIVSEYSEKFGVSYHVNEEKISQIPDPIKRAEVRASAVIAKKEAGKHLFTDPPVTEKLEGRYASEAQLKDWANNNPSKAKELQRVIDGIVDKINSKQVTLLEVLNNAPQMEKELTEEERNMVRNFFGLGALKLLRSKAE